MNSEMAYSDNTTVFIFVPPNINFLWSPTQRLFSESSRQYKTLSLYGTLSDRSLKGCSFLSPAPTEKVYYLVIKK